LGHVNTRGVPVQATLAGTSVALLAIIMSYVSPGTVFAFLVNSYGTVALFVYFMIALSQLQLRRQLERDAPEKLVVRMWGFPWLTYFAIAVMALNIVAMAFIPGQRIPLTVGVASGIGILGASVARKIFKGQTKEAVLF
jgi:GABA permease